jgi:hypothetical protein
MYTINYTSNRALDVYPSQHVDSTVLVILHGGGFIIGNKDVFSTIAKILNKEYNYTIVVPNYTLTKFDTGEIFGFFTTQVFFLICLAVSAMTKLEYIALGSFLVFIIVLNAMLFKNKY